MAQIKFVPGYFVDNNGQKTECLIRDTDWKDNPKRFDYKLSESDEAKTAEIADVAEFEISNALKYVRARVLVDRSGDVPSKFTIERNPIWSEETIFLKVLLEGKANLYYLEDVDLKRFYYKKEGQDTITALVYKKFISAGDVNNRESLKIYNNGYFRQQLNLNLNCGQKPALFFEKLEYNRQTLMKYFIDYNECEGVTPVYLKKTSQKMPVHFKITPGIELASILVNFADDNFTDVDYGFQVGYRLGVEAEFVLPFNKNKWSIFVEPNFQYFDAEEEIELSRFSSSIETVKYKYRAIQLPIGVRHYFFLSPSARIFVNGAFIYDIPLSGSVVDFSRRIDRDISGTGSFAFGLGFNLKKFSLEGRYTLSRDIVSLYQDIESRYSNTSIIFGYRF
ncbi:MAG: hypothetical protein NW226_10075 [Microscillaceae bacterium]|nr:hypothetical protein [Microscillaceae bacterium]